MRYFFYGSKAFGEKLIAELENHHEANNSAFLSGTSEDKLYYTTDDGMICCEFIDSGKGEAIRNTYNEISL